MIAMALSCRPRLLIADEPTTALDVTIQAQILRLLRELQLELGMSLIIITHDMAVIAQLADRVLVMYLGKDVESGPVQEVFAAPRHPYAQGLLASMPRLGAGNRQFIEPIAGSVPNVHETPSGCAFHPRCPRFMPAVCDRAPPAVVVVGAAPSGSADGGHLARCFLYGDDRTAAAARREPSTVIEDADGASFENRDQPAKRVHRF
jgi:peptide/nickel transport system ATP-binding protein